MAKVNVMFVCLGNICRSPLAEFVLKQKLEKAGLQDEVYVESCGTANYHVGENPDPRTISVARKNGITINHKGKQLKRQHFDIFDILLVMDDSNKTNALKIAGDATEFELYKMRDFDDVEKGADVIDPWFGDGKGFDICYDTLDRCCNNLITFLSDHDKMLK